MARPNKRNREIRRIAESFQDALIVSHQTSQHIVTAGPLPDPKTLSGFDEVKPGYSERIFAMAESDQKHRQEMEKAIVEAKIADRRAHRMEARIGQFCAIVLAMTFVVGGIVIVLHGYQWTGTGFAGGSLAGVAGAFIYGRKVVGVDAGTKDQNSAKESELARKE